MDQPYLISYFSPKTIASLVILLIVIVGSAFYWIKNHKKYRDFGKSRRVLFIVVAVIFFFLVGESALLIYQSVSEYNQAKEQYIKYQNQQKMLDDQYGEVVLCPSGSIAPDFKYSQSSSLVTFVFPAPLNSQWGIDFGDGLHSEITTTRDVPTMTTTTHTYQSGEYPAQLLIYDLKQHCEIRQVLAITVK